MRHPKGPIALVAILGAFALLATPALAAEFKASAPGKTKGKNSEEAVQEFRFGAFKISCTKAVSTGEVTQLSSKTLFDQVRYKGCSTAAKIGSNPIALKTKFSTPISYEYHSNGFAEFGGENEGEVKLTSPSSVEIKVQAIKCIIELPVQTVPVKAEKKPNGNYSAVSFETEESENKHKNLFPSGIQRKLLITNAMKGIQYSFVGGGQCEEFANAEGHAGTISGTLVDELKQGELWFE
jgi:hypothetical protein